MSNLSWRSNQAVVLVGESLSDLWQYDNGLSLPRACRLCQGDGIGTGFWRVVVGGNGKVRYVGEPGMRSFREPRAAEISQIGEVR